MKHRLFKMLMNAEGSSPGGGAPPPQSGTQAGSSAGASTGAAVPLDQVNKLISDAVAQAKNGIFADLRKSGVLKSKDGTAGEGTAAGEGVDKSTTNAGQQAPNNTAGISADEVQKLIAGATALERVATENKLTDKQRSRMEAALKAEKPADVGAWAKSYLEDMGIMKVTTSTTKDAAGNGGVLGGAGRSDRGSPGRDTSLAHEGQVWKMTAADVQALIREKGFQAAAHELRARMKQDLRGTKLTLPRPGS